jgi:hypothetical protein
VIDGLRVKRRKIRYTLSEPAAVTLRVQRVVRGRRKPVRTIRRAGLAGPNRVKLRALRRGRYRVVAKAVDAAGNASTARKVRFRIAR